MARLVNGETVFDVAEAETGDKDNKKETATKLIQEFVDDKHLKDLGVVFTGESYYPCLISNKCVQRITDSRAILMIHSFLLTHKETQMYTRRNAKDIYDIWESDRMGRADYIHESEIIPISFANEDLYSFDKLPFDRDDTMDVFSITTKCPTWFKFMSKMSNQTAFIHWFGSIFDDKSDRSQYLWLYGGGKNGKSAINEVIQTVLSRTAVTSVADKSRFKQFGMQQVIGKRLITFQECNDSMFPQTDLIKTFTGDKFLTAEVKGKNEFIKFANQAKVMIISNKEIHISSEKSDTRRALYCKMTEVTDADKMPPLEFSHGLLSEFGDFANICLTDYQINYPDKDDIKSDEAIMKEITDRADADLEDLVKAYLDIGPEYTMTAKDMSIMWKAFSYNGSSKQVGYAKKDFKGYLWRQYGIEKTGKAIRLDKHKVCFGYQGYRLQDWVMEIVEAAEAKRIAMDSFAR